MPSFLTVLIVRLSARKPDAMYQRNPQYHRALVLLITNTTGKPLHDTKAPTNPSP